MAQEVRQGFSGYLALYLPAASIEIITDIYLLNKHKKSQLAQINIDLPIFIDYKVIKEQTLATASTA